MPIHYESKKTQQTRLLPVTSPKANRLSAFALSSNFAIKSLLNISPHFLSEESRNTCRCMPPCGWVGSKGVNFVTQVGGAHGGHGARAYNGGLGTEPPVRYWGGAPGHRSKLEAKLLKLKAYLFFRSANKAQICPFLLPLKLLKYV